jgi:hypothetical protein
VATLPERHTECRAALCSSLERGLIADLWLFGGIAEVLVAFLKVSKSQLLANQHQYIWHTTPSGIVANPALTVMWATIRRGTVASETKYPNR